MFHNSGKSIAVSFGFIPKKLEVGKNSALEKLDLLFFFLKMKLVICACVVCVCVCCLLVWLM